MRWRVFPSVLGGSVEVPGDKSISHRALLIGALAGGAEVMNLAPGGDVQSTCSCLEALGVQVERLNGNGASSSIRLRIDGMRATVGDETSLDCGNSGTTMRLLAGVLAGQRIAARLEGDSSLSSRPMQRVIEPLALMGAEIESNEGRPPLTISNNGGSGSRLQGIDYALPVASAQVKSAVLLAGLRARGMTRVHEPIATRDHTERMLEAAGLKLERAAGWIGVEGGQSLQPFSLDVPGDQSSAAFLFAAVALQGGRITVRRLGVNPTRTGFLRVLEQLGCSVETSNPSVEFGEPVADVTVRGEARESVEVTPEQVPELIDELPLLALVATQAKGRTSIRGAAELRVKETDRIATTARALRALGANVQEAPDGLCIEGGQNLRGNEVSSEGDHRLAMMLAVAGTVAKGETVISGAEAARVSFPGFIDTVTRLGGRVSGV